MRLLPVLLVLACVGARPITEPTPPAQPPPTLAVDTHLHLTMSRAATPLFAGEPGDGQLSGSPRSRLLNQVTAEQLEVAGVRLIYGALWPPPAVRPGRTALDQALHQVALLEEFSERRPSFAVVHDVASARHALQTGRIAVLPQVEGGEGITSVEDVDRLYAAGVRCITLVHFVSNALAGGAHGQMAKNLLGIRSGELNPEGLSPLGKAVVARMADLGIVIDVSHSSDRTVEDVLAITEPRGVPILVSHTGARALLDIERNLPDALAVRIAKGGGLIGVSLFTVQLETPVEQQLPSHQVGTCDDAVAHWKHFAGVVPPESLVLGSDFNGYIVRPEAGGLCPHGLRNAGDLGELWAALLATGFPRAALDGMGERLLGLVAVVEGKASAAAQTQALRYPRTGVGDSARLLAVP